MSKFVFEGQSDDKFGECEQTNDDYDNCATSEPIWYELKTPDGAGIVVTGMYGNDINRGGGWLIGVEIIDEYKPVDWTITMNVSHGGYRNQLIVEAPEDAQLRCLNKSDDVDNDHE